MRTIDADALQEDFIKRCCGECDNCEYGKNEKSWEGCRLIDLAPTVEQPEDRYPVISLKPLTEREKEALKEALGNCQYVLIEGEEE